MKKRDSVLPLQFARLLAIDQSALVGRIAAGVLHDVVNPLTVVFGFTQAMRRDLQGAAGIPPPALTTDLKVIEDNASRCMLLAQEFLELVRPLSAEPVTEPLSPLLLARRAVALLAYPARFARTRITIDEQGSSSESQLLIESVRGWMLYLLVELLHNAVTATQDGEVTLRLTATKDELTISVRDTGEGVSDQDRDRIFETFYSTRAKGTGLGLPLVKAICLAHGGTFEFESTPKVGTTVKVVLPRESGRVDIAAAGQFFPLAAVV